MSIVYFGEIWFKDGYIGFMLWNGLLLLFLLWLIFFNFIRMGIVWVLVYLFLCFFICFFFIVFSCSCFFFLFCVIVWVFVKLFIVIVKNMFSSVFERSLVREGNFVWIKCSIWRKFCYSVWCLIFFDVGY